MIKFNKPSITDKERQNVIEAMNGNNILSGDGKFTMQVYKQFEERFGIKNMLLTTSGTTALEMASNIELRANSLINDNFKKTLDWEYSKEKCEKYTEMKNRLLLNHLHFRGIASIPISF